MTKSELYSAVRLYLNRPQMADTDLDLYSESARGFLNTTLKDHPRMIRTGYYTSPANQKLMPLPYDMLALHTIRRGTVLLRQFGAAATPSNACQDEEGFIQKGNCAELTSVPTEDTVYTIEYSQMIPRVTEATNWLRDWFPNVLLYTMLKEASVALKDRENGPVWAQHADQAIASLMQQGWNQNIAAAPRVRYAR